MFEISVFVSRIQGGENKNKIVNWIYYEIFMRKKTLPINIYILNFFGASFGFRTHYVFNKKKKKTILILY